MDKAPGATSFDVVAAARRALGIQRIGHAGTLDPDATGVLPLLVGEATKLMPYLADQDKEYLATLRLGVTTDTQDLSGRVLTSTSVPPIVVEFERIAAEAERRALRARALPRAEFYAAARNAFVIVATGESRLYGNVLVTKGVVTQVISER